MPRASKRREWRRDAVVVAHVHDLVAHDHASGIIVIEEGAAPELVMVADDLVPGNRLVEPGRLVGPLVIDGFRPPVRARARGDPLSVHDVDEPPELVVLGAVRIVAERDAEIEGRLAVEGIDRLDRRVEHVGGGQHDRGVADVLTFPKPNGGVCGGPSTP